MPPWGLQSSPAPLSSLLSNVNPRDPTPQPRSPMTMVKNNFLSLFLIREEMLAMVRTLKGPRVPLLHLKAALFLEAGLGVFLITRVTLGLEALYPRQPTDERMI